MASRPRQSSQGEGSGYLSLGKPRVLAHRGLAIDAPENTLLAFARAIAAGAQYVETDVHASHDGAAVIAHDPDLTRVAERDVKVEQLNIAELRRVDLGFGQGFCSLSDALDGFPETRFNIDIKSSAAIEPTVRAILDMKASDRVLVSSFSETRRVAALRGLPGVVSSASAPRFATALVAGKVGLSPVVRRALSGLVAVQVPERALGLRTTTARMLARLHDAGVEVHVWTVNEPQRMRELFELGVDGIVTDRADLALEVVRSL